jgi:hypothetical protein
VVAIKAVVLVPERDNQGRPFECQLWKEQEAACCANGGWHKW